MWWQRVVGGVAAVVLALAAGSGCATPGGGDEAGAEGSAPPGAATVVRVVDGDTLLIDLAGTEERVRLIGIDTPETKKPDSPVECFGPEASAHLGELLPAGTAVRLERDVELRDRYDRLLAYVYRGADDLFVNLAMARDGFAAQLTIPPNVAHADDVTAAVREARDANRGLWGSCTGPHQQQGPGP